jgi:hypothetical protein
MTSITNSLCWAGALVLLALANYAGLIADKDANIMFVLVPALWIASNRQGRCTIARTAA